MKILKWRKRITIIFAWIQDDGLDGSICGLSFEESLQNKMNDVNCKNLMGISKTKRGFNKQKIQQ